MSKFHSVPPLIRGAGGIIAMYFTRVKSAIGCILLLQSWPLIPHPLLPKDEGVGMYKVHLLRGDGLRVRATKLGCTSTRRNA